MNKLKITLKLLVFLQNEGYTAIFLQYGEDAYIPVKEDMDVLVENMSIVPLQEDEAISITDAIALFEELELSDKEIIYLFEND